MDTLEWQNYSLPNSEKSIQRHRYGLRTLANRNFIRENIENLRYPSQIKANLQSKSNGNMFPIRHNVERYFDNIERNRMRVGLSTGRNIQQKRSLFQEDVNSSLPLVVSKEIGVRTQTSYSADSAGNITDRRSMDNKFRQSFFSDQQKLGKLPPYLIRRKKEEAARIAAERAAAGRERTPDGHTRVSEEERIDTLHSLEEVYTKTIKEFNQVPLSADTSRAQKLRADLERKLADLEEVMAAFRKPVVFIKLD
ncbi:unnamed protein product [Rodentolepis nana]|uniref:Enkurin domain-containing protein n=1 Tax=Rodentolepis nana TaxID=102285 RepID=A0A0R3T9B2_RODNA|nr:unnamed protein product [Rodentolepis nana]